MTCKKCGSNNVNIQAVASMHQKRHGCLYQLLIGWWLNIFLWLWFTIPMIFIKLFFPKHIVSKTTSMAVCQNCGNSWKV